MSARIVSGIYQIRNTVNGKVYVGSAVNIADRWCYHRKHLNKGSHNSRHLQAAWLKHGAGAFSFNVVERVDRKDLIAREQWWLDAAFATGWQYNLLPKAGSPLGYKRTEAARAKQRGRRVSAETRAKISAGNKGKIRSAAARAKISAAAKERPGRQHSAETLAKMSLAAKKRPAPSTESRAKMSLAGKARPRPAMPEQTRAALALANIGRPHSAETREKLSLAKKGKPCSPAALKQLALARLERQRRHRN